MGNKTEELTYKVNIEIDSSELIEKLRKINEEQILQPNNYIGEEKKESWLAVLFLTNREDYSMEFDKKPSIEWCGEGGSLSLQIKSDDFCAAFGRDYVIGFSLGKE